MEAGKAVGYTRVIALRVRLLIRRKDVTLLLSMMEKHLRSYTPSVLY